MEKIADAVKELGSFSPSTHLTWHFNETNNEVVRPFYIAASLMNDFLNKTTSFKHILILKGI